MSAALEVKGLGVVRESSGVSTPVVTDLSFTLAAGSSVGLVGRSGAGKTTVGNALLGLLPATMRVTEGSEARLGSDDLLALRGEALRAVRGRRLAMVFQEPLLALDPAMRVGAQLAGALQAHGLATGAEAMERAVAMLARVGLADAAAAVRRYPHELSGGMRQRLLLALALLLQPDVLIADEPTTALDPTLQAQLLDLLDKLRAETGTALLLISHDLDLVAERCDRALLLEDGRIVAEGPAGEIAARRRVVVPASDRSATAHATASGGPLVALDDVAVHFGAARSLLGGAAEPVRAVDGVSLSIRRGECVALIGESASGKTTLARAALGLEPITSGRALFGGVDLAQMDAHELRGLRRRAQLVSQDAGASLTPHLSVEALVTEGLLVHEIAEGAEAQRRGMVLLHEVGLDESFAPRLARSLSSGERQRVAIARALACEPMLLICDEPVANLDAESHARLLALLAELRERHKLALLLISHDLHAARALASRVAVMFAGRIVERSDSSAGLDDPWMPYSQVLRAAVPTGEPIASRTRILRPLDTPATQRPAGGCAFYARCPHPARDAQCANERPDLTELAPGRWVACHKVAAPSKS